MENSPEYNQHRSGFNRALLGLAILVWGVLLLFHRLGYPIPGWIFTYPVIIIVIGLYISVRSGFRSSAGWIVTLIGAYILSRHQHWIDFSIGAYFWPLVIILIGLSMVFRPKRNRFTDPFSQGGTTDSGSVFDTVAIFWGAKRAVLSKKFSRGDIVNIFGGTEINLTQADIEGTAVIEVVAIFGGVKLIVPPDWEVRTDVVNIFAGTDDKRKFHNASSSKKVLLVTGTAIFAGIDIISY